MNCRKFESDLAEWMAGRLSLDQAQRMQAHQAVCAKCQRSAQEEQMLRYRWHDLPHTPDISLWPRLERRLAVAAPKRRIGFFHPLAMSASAAAVILTGAFLWTYSIRHSPSAISITSPHGAMSARVNERHIVQMISSLQQLPDEESDTFFVETQRDRQAQRRVLLVDEVTQ